MPNLVRKSTETVTVTRYYATCKICGKEIRVGSLKSGIEVCGSCLEKQVLIDFRKEVEFLIGSWIIDAKCSKYGELTSLVVKVIDGRKFEINSSGSGDELDYQEMED